MRIAIGGISHESSTFATVPTGLTDFEQRGTYSGAKLLETFNGTKSPVGGFIDAARDASFTVIPTLMASATPGGPVTREATEVLTGRLVDGIRAAHEQEPLDGVLLSLHGAMVSEIDDDGESYILRAVRKVVGPNLPVIVELDLHGNITQEMVDLATIPVAYDEYPHTDPYERGYEAGLLMARVVRSKVTPASALVKVPLLSGLQRQYTHAEPMRSVKALAREIEHEAGILNVSYLPGFSWADIAPTNFSVIVTSENDPDHAQDAAERLAQYVWDRRNEFVVRPVPVDEAVQRGMSAEKGPIVIADIGDNPGGGGPADGTVLLEALLRLGATNTAFAPINDPESVEKAVAAGEGNKVSLNLGAKVDSYHGTPLDVTGTVLRITDGQFVHKGPMSTGVPMNLAQTAVVEVDGQNGGSVTVIITSHRYQPTDLEVFRSQGIEPTERQILGIKSSVHFRAAFTPIAQEIIEADTPGLTSPHLDRLEFKKLTRPIYPLDGDIDWSPS